MPTTGPGISAGDAVWTIDGNLSPLEAALAAGERAVNSTTQSMEASWQKVGLAVGAAGAAITGAFSLSVNEAAGFESKLAAIASLGTENMGKLEEDIRGAAVAFGLDLTQAAEGAYDMISSGATAATAPKILEDAARAAAAGQTELATSIEFGMGMANAFGIELTDLSGVFDTAFIGVNKGVMTFEELASSAGKSAPAFAANKIALDEMVGAAAALTLGAVPASEAFTQLNAVVTGFTRQGQSAILETRGLGGALQWLSEQTGGNKTQMLEFLGSTEAMSAALALTGSQAETFSSIMGDMGDKLGATQEAFDIIAAKDPTFAWKQLTSTLQDLSIEIGQALLPALKRITDAITPVVKAVSDWAQENPILVATIVTVIAIIGGLMLAIGPILIALPAITAAVGVLGTAFAAVSLGPVALFGAALAALVSGGYLVAQTWPVITSALSNWEQPVDAAQAAGQQIYTDIGGWMDAVSGAVQSTKDKAADWNDLVIAMQKSSEQSTSVWEQAGEAIAWALSNPVEVIKQVWGALVDFFWDVANLLMVPINWVMGMIDALAARMYDIASQFTLGFLNYADPSAGTGQQNLTGTGMTGDIPGLAIGGPVSGGMPYIVGENGPELFVPDQAGRIVPNGQAQAMLGSPSVNITFGNVSVRSDSDIRALSEQIASATVRELRTIGATV